MGNKIYTITDDSYYSWNGCDCCSPDYFECYNVEDGKFPITGHHSRYSVEEVVRDILTEEGYNITCETPDLSVDILGAFGIKLVIQGD